MCDGPVTVAVIAAAVVRCRHRAASATTAAKRPNAAVTPPSRPPTPPQALEGSGVALGAQDLYTEEKGAYTGATSIAMLKSIPNLQ
jgi:triosephosphate isomerase